MIQANESPVETRTTASRLLRPGAQSRRDGYAPVDYAFREVQGLSKDSLAAHRELYLAYVKQANEVYDAVRRGPALQGNPAVTHVRESLSRRWSFEASGVRLHEWYFEQLDGRPGARSPAAGSSAMAAMDEAFGDFDSWLLDVQALAETRGVGWVVTVLDPRARLLANVWVDLHHVSVPAGQRIVFALDLWEHAYWTQFGSKGRKDYVRAVIENTDWRVVEQRCVD